VNPGSLIVLEGLDGSGKSTQVQALAAGLRAAGHELVVTREPTGGAAGRRIRAAAAAGDPLPPERELAWFVEDRREHVRGVIRPALEAGRIVVSDRYFLSTVAYQGARGLDWRELLAQSEAEFPAPDLAVVLEIAPGEGLARVADRGHRAEPLFEDREFLARVAEIFAALDRPYLARVDAGATPEQVGGRIRALVRERLGL